MLSSRQSLKLVGATFFNSQPGLEYLISEGDIKETTVIVSDQIDVHTSLQSTECKELCQLPLDHSNALVEDIKLLNGLNIQFHFNRRHPLVRYYVARKEALSENCEIDESNKQLASKSSDNTESHIILHIKPSRYPDYPAALLTGDIPHAQISKITNLVNEPLSVFMVPHQESKECLSLLPEEMNRQLTDLESLSNAALHLALYHRRESFCQVVDRLEKNKLKDLAKSFHHYYLYICNPEVDLAAMLKTSDAKLGQTFSLSNNFQLNWYKKSHQVFSESVKDISKEEGKQQKRIALLRDSLAWAHFYQHVQAEVYVISAEDLKQEYCLEVLNGIIIANIWRNSNCCIVITDALPYSLDEIIQRDVRKLAFADANSKPIVRIGFLDKCSPKWARSVPLFTINPWAQIQHHHSSIQTVSVDPSKHIVSGIGDEYKMHLIRDELDIKDTISTRNSNRIISHITHNYRPVNSGVHHEELRFLEAYLQLIGFKDTFHSVKEVLECLIGPSLVTQLRTVAIDTSNPNLQKIIPFLLEQKATGQSKFTLTPTKSSAVHGEVHVYLPQDGLPDDGQGGKVETATFIVKDPRKYSLDITLDLQLSAKARSKQRPLKFKVSKHLDLKTSCGSTVADHIFSVCCKEEAWIHARDLTVGELLHIFLREEKALIAIQSLPLIISFPLSKCKINHYLTTINMDSHRELQEAHVHVNSFMLTPFFITKDKETEVTIQVEHLIMHLYPSLDIDECMIWIEGECTVTVANMPMRFACYSSSESQKDLKLFFVDRLPIPKVFDFFGINVSLKTLTLPLSDESLDDKIAYNYEGGFMLSQLMRNTEEVSLTSVFFYVEFIHDIEHLLPLTLSHIEHVKITTFVHFPSTRTPKLGIEALFTAQLKDSNSVFGEEFQSQVFNCCLSVCPSNINNDYVYEVTVKQCTNQYENQNIKGMSVYAIVTALNPTLGRNISEGIKKIPKLGKQILDKVSLRKIVLRLSNRKIHALELHVTMTKLDIIPDKISIRHCTLVVSYAKEESSKCLKLECSGNLLFLRQYEYSVHFSLPTTDNKGEMTFTSYSSDLSFKHCMDELKLPFDIDSNAVLAAALDMTVRKVVLEFHFTSESDHLDKKLKIVAANVGVIMQKLDIGLVTFHGIELDVSTKLCDGHYVTGFMLGAYISDALHAQLKYNPDNHTLSGQVRVAFSKCVTAVDVLHTFKPSISSYNNMKEILQEKFMDVLKSDLSIVTNAGLTASICVTISLPSQSCKCYSLEHLNLQVEDVLKISSGTDSYVLNSFQFEYFNKRSSEDVASFSHLSIAVHKLNSKENMTLDFDFTSKQDSSLFTAKVEAGPQGGFLRLSSAIDLAGAAVPNLPKFDIGLPHILDVELLSGSITFAVRPSLQPIAFDINILIDKWRVFDDPLLTVHKITMKTTWMSGSCPELSFNDCSLAFLEHELNLSGKLTSEEVYIECNSAKKLCKSDPTQFKSILENYTPTSQQQPVLPTNIGLPPMEVELRNLIIHLKEEENIFNLNTLVVAQSPWNIMFGTSIIPVHQLGAAIEWEKQKNLTKIYKAFLYGTMELFGMRVDMEMLLGKNIDSMVSAVVSHPESLYYGQIADNLLTSEAMIPCDQYNPKSSGLSELVPAAMQDIALTSACTVLNVTKKQFFLSSKVKGWGTGTLLMGYLVETCEMDYIISLSLDECFKFGRLSECLVFVDELIQLKNLNVLVSSTDISNLSRLTNHFCHSFSGSMVCETVQKPFYESKFLTLANYRLRTGTTIFAEINIAQSRGGIAKLLELGDRNSLENDLAIMTHIGKSETKRDLEIQAWIPRIKLFEVLEFSDIHMMYKVQSALEFELTGTITLYLKMKSKTPMLKFSGKLSVDDEVAKFCTEKCNDIVYQPCGINISVNRLRLDFKMYLNGESPDLFVSGGLVIGGIRLTCKFLLKGISFKVFVIRLECGLMLSTLFHCSELEWPIKLDIGIKRGQFYYAASTITFDGDGTYETGYHLECVITLLNSDFRIKADIPSDRSDLIISGRSIEPIDFFFAKVTGAHPYTHEGPELKYEGSKKSLSLKIGVEILKHPCFEGVLKYNFQDDSLEGMVRYPGQFLWISEPSMTVRWSKNSGFEIVDFSLFGDVPGFSILRGIAKFAKVIYDIVAGILKWDIKLHLKTGSNPDPQKYLVKLILYGEVRIRVIGFTIPVFPLPEVPILLPKVDDFSFSKLPKYILKCLWESAGPICRSLLHYINPWNLLEKSVQLIWSGIKGAITTVANVARKIGEGVVSVAKTVANVGTKIWRGFCSIFGRSAFIIDMDSGSVLGYIRGGKGGCELYDERYIVEEFGPILTANAIGAMAHDVHKHYKACVDAQDNENPCDEIDGEERQLEIETMEGLDELKNKAEELVDTLTIEADKVLTVKDVSITFDRVEEGMLVKWFVYNPERGEYYNGDKGDIEYHVKITATVINDQNVELLYVYDNIFINKSTDKESDASRDKKTEDNPTEPLLPLTIDRETTEGNKLVMVTGASKAKDANSLVEANSKEDDQEQQLMDKTYERKTCEGKKVNEECDHQPKCISFRIPSKHYKNLKLDNTVGICVSIQPRVTLEVKMLPPDKIATEHKIDQHILDEGDTLWMDDAKREIEENGRINEVTLKGKFICKQHLIRPASENKVCFTAQCNKEKGSLRVSGDITPVPAAKIYIVQLVDEADLTTVIKQCRLHSHELHYTIEVVTTDFPDTSSGPYHVSIIALCADLSACSAYTNSELKIFRYCPPESLTEILPNLDSSSSDIVRLQWKRPKSSKYKGKSKETASGHTSDKVGYASPTQENGSISSPSEQMHRTGRDDGHSQTDVPVESLSPNNENATLSTESAAAGLDDKIVSQTESDVYRVTVKGVCIKKPNILGANHCATVNIDNVDSSDEVFKTSMLVCKQQESQEVFGYEFSLTSILKTMKYTLQDGLLFQCQVVTDGISHLHSIPTSFNDFVLLAPPMDLEMSTLVHVHQAGLQIGWEYSMHAIGYRIELVNELTSEVAFSKVLKCATGTHGKAMLYNSDLKNIPDTVGRKGYRLQMYTLGFGQQLIRCLEPSVAEGVFHIMPSDLQYLKDSNIVRVKFLPFTNVGTTYVVQLYRVSEDSKGGPLHLTSKHVSDYEVLKERVIDFSLKEKWRLLLESGDMITAWVCSTSTYKNTKVTYIGAPQDEVQVMNSPQLIASPYLNSNDSVKAVKLSWSEIAKAHKYQYGYYLWEKKELKFVSLMETQERRATINFDRSLLEHLCDSYCQFQVYVTAVGEPASFVVGAVSLDTNIFQCIKSDSLEAHGAIIYTSITLQLVWRFHLIDYAVSNYYVSSDISPCHLLFPSGTPFPSLKIPKNFLKIFWRKESSLFLSGKN